MKPNPTITQEVEKTRVEFDQLIEAGACSKALTLAMSLVAFGNKWFSDHTPWKTLDPQIIAECVTIIREATAMLKYFIPNGTAKVQNWLVTDTLGDISVLYKKLDIKEIQERTW
jgi:methionyl-tRNA synthetase